MVLAFLVCGGRLTSAKGLVDIIEEVDGRPQRSFSWSVDGGCEVTFALPSGETETLDFGEFRKRWESDEWVRSNVDHPLAYLRGYSDAMLDVQAKLRAQKPCLCVRKGSRFAIIPQDADPVRKAELLAML